jgi:hypothetical protein
MATEQPSVAEIFPVQIVTALWQRRPERWADATTVIN